MQIVTTVVRALGKQYLNKRMSVYAAMSMIVSETLRFSDNNKFRKLLLIVRKILYYAEISDSR